MAGKTRELKVAITGDASDLEKALDKLDKFIQRAQPYYKRSRHRG